MKKKDAFEFAVSAVLILVLLSVVMNSTKRLRQAKSPKAKSEAVLLKKEKSFKKKWPRKENTARIYTSQDTSFARLEEKTRDLRLKRDPFALRPMAKASEKRALNLSESMARINTTGLTLTGIIWDKDNPLAIINDSMLRKGDALGANKVIEIRPDSVTLNDGVNNIELTLE